jgi:parallel beta-helix repeat protein
LRIKEATMSASAIGRGLLAASLASLGVSTAIAAKSKSVTVDCTRGETIANALTGGNEGKPLLVVVKGVCNESVSISRDDVTLQGESGAAINGPDPAVDTLTVRAHRVTVEDIAIGGGRNGITGLGAAQLTVRRTTVQSGRNGVVYASGSSGTIDDCTIQSNARDGVAVDAASATIINSTISNNTRNGVLVTIGGAARIGVDNRNGAAGNFIRQNGSTGIVISSGGYALIAMNEITGNGVDPTLPRQGISVIEARADLAGGNTISGHAAQGLFTRASAVQVGGPALGFSTVNTFSGNGSLGVGGIFAFLGSSITVRDAVISNNPSFGLGVSTRSQGQIFSSTIQNNSSDGIRLVFGSALLPLTPGSTVSGNAGWGIQCSDPESSVVNTSPPFITFSANGAGDVSPSCTSF